VLSGWAYGANIGWINFAAEGAPRVSLTTGRLQGQAYGANVGWITLGDFSLSVATQTIAPAVDSDADGLPDFWELAWFGNLGTASAVSDRDGDGESDAAEYAADTDPLDPLDRLRVLEYRFDTAPTPDTAKVAFTSQPTRLYAFEYSTNLASWTMSSLGWFAPDAGTSTTRVFSGAEAPRWFFKVRVKRPLSP
jgi:hypothetical protein